MASGNLRVPQPLRRRWKIAFSICVAAERGYPAILFQKHGVCRAGRNLRIRVKPHRMVALSSIVVAASSRRPIAAKQNSVTSTCRNLHVRHTRIQRGDVALAQMIQAESNRDAIAAKKHRVPIASGNLRVRQTPFQRWDITLTVVVAAARKDCAICAK